MTADGQQQQQQQCENEYLGYDGELIISTCPVVQCAGHYHLTTDTVHSERVHSLLLTTRDSAHLSTNVTPPTSIARTHL